MPMGNRQMEHFEFIREQLDEASMLGSYKAGLPGA
jgi:hypothetical protein